MIPLILAALAIEKTVSAGINYFGQRAAAKGYEREGEMSRELYGKSADLLEHQALDAEARGREAALRQQRAVAALTSAQRVGFAGQGVDLSVGSAQQVIASDRRTGMADAAMIRENAAREAFGFRQQEAIQRGQGDLAYTAGRNRAKFERWQSAGTLANYAGDMYTMYKGYSKGTG
jgi:hypothetical protein